MEYMHAFKNILRSIFNKNIIYTNLREKSRVDNNMSTDLKHLVEYSFPAFRYYKSQTSIGMIGCCLYG